MEIQYETAQLSDYEEIHHVMQTSARELSRKAYNGQLKAIFDSFYVDKTTHYIKKTLENRLCHTIVAKANGAIIGFIQLKFSDRICNLSHLYILPGYERQSIGTTLFSLAKDRAVESNSVKLRTESTLNALSYYEKHGFVNNGLIPDESAYDLELELSR